MNDYNYTKQPIFGSFNAVPDDNNDTSINNSIETNELDNLDDNAEMLDSYGSSVKNGGFGGFNSVKKIGEGTYGCVYEPQLPCDNERETKRMKEISERVNIPSLNVNASRSRSRSKSDESAKEKNRIVTKLTTGKNAIDEKNEYLQVDKMDRQYVIHTPIIGSCKVNASKATGKLRDGISKCKSKHVQRHGNDLVLINQLYSGEDLDTFCEPNNLRRYFRNDSEGKKMDMFWLQVYQLFVGLDMFYKNKSVHYDIKPSNILYDSSNERFNFIDFGLMEKMSDIKRAATKSELEHSMFHWSYPLDNGYMNQNTWRELHNMVRGEGNADLFSSRIAAKFCEFMSKGYKETPANTYHISASKLDAFFYTFHYIYNVRFDKRGNSGKGQGKESASIIFQDVKSFFVSFFSMNLPYSKYLNRAVQSIDVFGMGMTLCYMANQFITVFGSKGGNVLRRDFFEEVLAIGRSMCSFDMSVRLINTAVLLRKYEMLLAKYGVLNRLGVQITRDHKIVSSLGSGSGYRYGKGEQEMKMSRRAIRSIMSAQVGLTRKKMSARAKIADEHFEQKAKRRIIQVKKDVEQILQGKGGCLRTRKKRNW